MKLGLYDKYAVKHNYDEAGKHNNCPFFVLDIRHDIHARHAIEEYIYSCFGDFPTLASELQGLLDSTPLERNKDDASV
jgi:hypothetical protein